MMALANSGRLDDWCRANIKWLHDTFGEDNLVSCMLHMDEKTPHLHATVVAVVSTRRKRREREGEPKYKEKAPAPRLCANELMTRSKLRQYQDTYAQAMAGFGLKRGVVAGDCTNIFRRHTLAQTHSHERAPCHMRCQQLILRTHLPRLGASPLLFWYPVSRHTSELADLFEMRIVFLIGYSRKGTRIIFIRSLWIFTYKFPYNQG